MLNPKSFDNKKLVKQLSVLMIIFQSLFFATGAAKNVAGIFQTVKDGSSGLPTLHQHLNK